MLVRGECVKNRVVVRRTDDINIPRLKRRRPRRRSRRLDDGRSRATRPSTRPWRRGSTATARLPLATVSLHNGWRSRAVDTRADQAWRLAVLWGVELFDQRPDWPFAKSGRVQGEPNRVGSGDSGATARAKINQVTIRLSFTGPRYSFI